jgi:hypothetical protein
MKTRLILILITGLLLFAFACEAPDQQSKQQNTIERKTRAFSTEMYPNCWFNEKTLQSKVVHTGYYASLVDTGFQFSYGFREKFENIDSQLPKNVTVNVWVMFPELGNNADVIVSIDSLAKNKFWAGLSLKDSVSKASEWKQVRCKFILPKRILPGDKISIYVWGKAKKIFYVDDLSVSFEY